MRNIIVILFFCTFFTSHAQYKLKFSYDPLTGNQVVRELCLGCQVTGRPAKEVKEIEALTQEDLLKFSPDDIISYYPNPVKEELFLKWELADQNLVTSIQIYNISGQVLKNYSDTKANSINIPFQDYSSGVYLVQLNYDKGNSKTIKIIKK
ncbi:T9SS type A sorting domain-containing protein [Flavobacterium hungaricum]|uniref:T9SS C-terminal target domain-containing protein n=1 Tax=Flavobacterium hungaricum TaxID=2082725 RepID=A0ABR9TNS5_9FLAO|nr:T9SS type A sorting domain-containing protein [Flavobacterium hungaricum]MBE8726459.1 T9SS C-terminal target domain-containing protein [Flavobacterium hungaricum]